MTVKEIFKPIMMNDNGGSWHEIAIIVQRIRRGVNMKLCTHNI